MSERTIHNGSAAPSRLATERSRVPHEVVEGEPAAGANDGKLPADVAVRARVDAKAERAIRFIQLLSGPARARRPRRRPPDLEGRGGTGRCARLRAHATTCPAVAGANQRHAVVCAGRPGACVMHLAVGHEKHDPCRGCLRSARCMRRLCPIRGTRPRRQRPRVSGSVDRGSRSRFWHRRYRRVRAACHVYVPAIGRPSRVHPRRCTRTKPGARDHDFWVYERAVINRQTFRPTRRQNGASSPYRDAETTTARAEKGA